MDKCNCKYFKMIDGDLFCSVCGAPAKPSSKMIEKVEDKQVKKSSNKSKKSKGA